MKNSWAQPSLSRDFILLSAAVLFVLILISGWVTYRTYERNSEKINLDLAKEAIRIENTISAKMADANYMLSSLGRQIVINPDRDYTKLAQSLKSFDSKGNVYSIFSWISTDKKIVVSSNKGVLEEPVDISDRDFIKESANDSWKIHIGRPIEGRVSGRWVIPVAMGITDYTGKFIGIVSLSIDIEVFTEQIKNLVKRDGVSFAVVSREMAEKDFVVLAEVSEHNNFLRDNFSAQKFASIDLNKDPSGLLTRGSLLWGTGIYSYYYASNNFPYIVMLGYDADYSDGIVRAILWSRLSQILLVAIFFIGFLWVVRMRVIIPVLEVTESVAAIARGDRFNAPPKHGQVEIEGLVNQVRKVSEYIEENKRVESELCNKMFLLKKAKENAEINMRSKSEYLAYIAQEMRMSLNNIVGFAQVLKDQVYGAIENRKYRQYATDIFTTTNQLIDKMQHILLHSKTESGYINLQETNLHIANVANATVRQMTEKLDATNTSINVSIDDSVPQLLADEFRMQQIINNLFLLVIDNLQEGEAASIGAKIISERRDRNFFVINVGNSKFPITNDSELLDLWYKEQKHDDEQADIRLELVKALVELHGGVLKTTRQDEENILYTVIFPHSKIVY